MSITLTRLPEKPILLISFPRFIQPDDLVSIASFSLLESAQGAASLYRILDMRMVGGGVADVIDFVRAISTREMPGYFFDESFRNILVGDTLAARLTRDALVRRVSMGHQVPLFTELSDALRYISRHHNRQARSSQSSQPMRSER